MKHLKRNMVSILAMLVCCICLGMAVRPLNASASASWHKLKFGQWVRTDSLTKNNDTRYYTITVTRPGYVTLYFNSFFYVAGVKLQTEDLQTTIYENGWLYGGSNAPATWSKGQWVEKGTYLIKVYAADSGSAGEFWLKADYKAAGNNEVEPNNTYGKAEKISLNQKKRGLRSAQDSDDYYKFTLSQEKTVTLQFTSYITGCAVEIRDSSMNVVKSNGWIFGTEESPSTESMNVDLTAGTYYVHVSSGSTGYYDLIVKPVKVLAEDITISRDAASIYKGNKLQLRAYVSPSDTTNRKVVWSTNNPYIASVSSTGLVTAKAPGKARITARTTDGTKLSASCTITVRNKTLTVSPTKVTLVKGKYKTLKVTGAPAVTTKALKFSTTNSKIATVSATGRIYAKKAGICRIKVVGNGLTRYVTVTVKAK